MSQVSAQNSVLFSKIETRQAKIAVIGLGYVGLPLMLAAVTQGFRVIGFDINPDRVAELNGGRTPLEHIPAAKIAAARAAGLFEASGDFARLGEADAIIICVPTPLGRHREPDLHYVVQTIEAIAGTLRPGQLIVLESTTYPGTTSDVCRPILEQGGLQSGRDFYLAFSPEREDPGNASFSTRSIPKIVGGDGPEALALAQMLYAAFVDHVVPVSSTATAEAVKITENIFRAVNIALVNELKVIYHHMGIDVFEVIDAAKTKPFGFMPFYPGPGLGGHCIPIDPFYLSWKARAHGLNTRFIELAGEINSDMPRWVIDRLAEALDRRMGLALSRAAILIVGAAYKKNISDIRESPALTIIEMLQERGARVDFHDPHVPEIPMTREHGKLAGLRSVALSAQNVAAYDAVMIVTDHDRIDWPALVDAAKLVVDTRNATRKAGVRSEKIVAA
ncbi:nucleotide sugar dehydrogenase [Methylovirgula sp. 4M-Z18]|uniref:nucleotide sugar dehydrogenase n=1 Tax=Methylovirgula sp. 4M-Z18 TaxID=2293567 RepID=UPI000E2F9CB9|nr:nucleotide sugar dehydrogenase [Methylovirgula sp. 4M-Z18]RFB79660.1 nucleotide sugar dehydrogenase [Methylovirgula sp. 4M-Z18]